jgi:uncharacterized repeat protein (TIGR03803 family)
MKPHHVNPVVPLVLVLLSAGSGAAAQTLTTIVLFTGSDGANPHGSLIADANGNLLGTTLQGGANGYGTVFEIVRTDQRDRQDRCRSARSRSRCETENTETRYAMSPTVLVSFDRANGANPGDDLIADPNGNLFGTTSNGGGANFGTVFEVVKTGSVYASTPTTLVSFIPQYGADPLSLTTDANGNLFGTTSNEGQWGYGTVFEVVTTGTGYALASLFSFDDHPNGAESASLITDANGNLFGTTAFGGPGSGVCCGTVFEIMETSTGYARTPTTLVSFNNSNGAYPLGRLIFDASGALYGTTRDGGTGNSGTVFKLAPPTIAGGTWTESVLYSFTGGSDGANPYAGLITDASGALYGTTYDGGTGNSGTVFKLAPPTIAGGTWTESVLYSFTGGIDGANPSGNLIADASGALYGTTVNAGGGYGTVFKLTLPATFAGIPGQANCVGQSISFLAHRYGGIAHAAAALGYASVADLRRAVVSYCGS